VQIHSPVWDHWGAMVLAARPLVGSLDEARDCASEAVLQYLERQPQDVANLEAFMVTVAKRRAIDHTRASERARIRDARFAGESAVSAPDLAEDIAARAEALWADEQARLLLQPRVYELLRMVADGVPMSEVARQLDLTDRAVQSHLLRARRIVRAALARTLAVLGVGVAALRRWSGPVATTTVALAAAVFVMRVAPAQAPTTGPRLALLPVTTYATDDGTGQAAPTTHASGPDAAARADSVARRSGGGAARHTTVLKVQTSLIGAEIQRRDDGRPSRGPVDQVLNCLKGFRIEIHYQGCDSRSAEQSLGETAGDRPLLPAVG
jgi:RNA polymerase sigma factor (sigma-70 family)